MPAMDHLDGVPWFRAELPRRWHRCWPQTWGFTLKSMPDIDLLDYAEDKARYQLNLALAMIREHKNGRSIAWSDRKPLVEEEFS